jgi:carbonic anhydrase
MENLSGSFDINIKKILGPILPTQIYFSYMGSRTIPPCTEDVNWYIIEKPMTMTSG